MTNRYHTELCRILDDTAAPAPTTKSIGEIEAEIAEISAILKGPLNNIERLWLVEDRQELRKQIAALKAGAA